MERTRNLLLSLRIASPSTSIERSLAPSIHGLISARSSAADWWAVLTSTTLRIGTKSALPSGTEHLRVAEPPKEPTRNHTGPRWPVMHCSPIWSKPGLPVGGNDRTYCHHCAVHSGKLRPNGDDRGEKTRESSAAAGKPLRNTPSIRTMMGIQCRVRRSADFVMAASSCCLRSISRDFRFGISGATVLDQLF